MANIKQPEEEIEDLRKKYHLLGNEYITYRGGQESILPDILNGQTEIQRTDQSTRERKQRIERSIEVKSKVNSYQAVQSNGGGDVEFQTKTEKDLGIWRRKLDEQRNATLAKKKELLGLQDKLKEIGNEHIDLNTDDNPQMRTIRMLENRLDKAMIKYNEAQSIKKTYELIVKRLKDERVGYDNQLAAIEQSLKGKEHDFEELLLLSHDANHAKEVAEAELRKFEIQFQAKKKMREKEVKNRRDNIHNREEMKQKQESKQKEKLEKKLADQKRDQENYRMQNANQQLKQQSKIETDKQKLMDYEEGLRKIKDATGVSDVNEIIQKFATQDDTYNNLFELKVEHERNISSLNDDKSELQSQVDRLRYEGLENMTRKQVDEVEKNVVAATNKFDRNKDKLERINKVVVNAKAGIEHLSDKLGDIKLEGTPNVVVTDNTLVEALIQCEQKCQMIYNETKTDPQFKEVIARIKGQKQQEKQEEKTVVEPTNNNIRVKLPDKDDEELSDIEMDADPEQDVNERMKIKVEAQLRHDRMVKNKVKKGKK